MQLLHIFEEVLLTFTSLRTSEQQNFKKTKSKKCVQNHDFFHFLKNVSLSSRNVFRSLKTSKKSEKRFQSVRRPQSSKKLKFSEHTSGIGRNFYGKQLRKDYIIIHFPSET